MWTLQLQHKHFQSQHQASS